MISTIIKFLFLFRIICISRFAIWHVVYYYSTFFLIVFINTNIRCAIACNTNYGVTLRILVTDLKTGIFNFDRIPAHIIDMNIALVVKFKILCVCFGYCLYLCIQTVSFHCIRARNRLRSGFNIILSDIESNRSVISTFCPLRFGNGGFRIAIGFC